MKRDKLELTKRGYWNGMNEQYMHSIFVLAIGQIFQDSYVLEIG